MERTLDVGDQVVFVDSRARQCNALVTCVHGDLSEGYVPSINLVFVSKDAAKEDPYGRQIERDSSVVHQSNQYAHGNYWMWPGDSPTPYKEPSKK